VSADGSAVHLYERFAAVVQRHRVVVYGDPSPDLRAALDGIGATYLLPLAGFSR
jgi:pyruvate carboxylase